MAACNLSLSKGKTCPNGQVFHLTSKKNLDQVVLCRQISAAEWV
jgi:hypothetical protein